MICQHLGLELFWGASRGGRSFRCWRIAEIRETRCSLARVSEYREKPRRKLLVNQISRTHTSSRDANSPETGRGHGMRDCRRDMADSWTYTYGIGHILG